MTKSYIFPFQFQIFLLNRLADEVNRVHNPIRVEQNYFLHMEESLVNCANEYMENMRQSSSIVRDIFDVSSCFGTSIIVFNCISDQLS